MIINLYHNFLRRLNVKNQISNHNSMPTDSLSQQAIFKKGLRDGLPICLGYISVSFTFGMMTTENGLPFWLAMLISLTNLTSAGQFAGTALIIAGGTYLEIAVTTFVINIRYMLMSLSLAQKVEAKMTIPQRLALSFGITDEVFAVAIQQKGLINATYLAGLITMPFLGWLIGTLLGATTTNLLPIAWRSALGIAIYGMFIAIIMPPARRSMPIMLTLLLSIVLSSMLKWLPIFGQLSAGWKIIICAILASAYAARRFPIEYLDQGAE
jgi:predicted branched-subunit amino acid permease